MGMTSRAEAAPIGKKHILDQQLRIARQREHGPNGLRSGMAPLVGCTFSDDMEGFSSAEEAWLSSIAETP